MIRKAIIVVLVLGTCLTARMWLNAFTMQRAASLQCDFLSIGIPGLSNILLTDDRWLPILDQGMGATGLRLTLPYWMAITFLVAYPTIAFVRGPLRRWRRRRKGFCLKCGYNLTGNVSGVCSECGTKT